MASSSHHHHHHHLIISNPFTNDDDDNNSFDATPTAVPQTSSGLRAQLQHLLPRHAFFHVQVVIHEIASVPFVSGEFSVRWKFKNVHNAPGSKSGSGLLNIVKSHRKKDKGKGKMGEEDEQGEDHDETNSVGGSETHPPSVDERSSVKSSSSSSGSSSSSSRTKKTGSSHTAVNSAPSLTSTANSSSSTTAFPNTSSQSTPSLTSVPNATTPARGQTPFLKLKDHGVTWEHTLSILVRMDVDRDPQSHLLPSPLKLVILYHDADAPGGGVTKPFGVVYLDLAQYACKGEVTRRYLLRESKTNATLRLTTLLTHIPTTSPSSSSISTNSAASSSTNTFTAPPLPKGEILNGISAILEGSAFGITGENDVYRVRPKGLDLYGPYYDQTELEIDLLGRASSPRSKLKSKAREHFKHMRTVSSEEPVFDPSRLPLAYGPKTTETLIEALFNPVRTTEKRRESPFTVYVPHTSSTTPRTTPQTSDSGSTLHSINSTAFSSSTTVASPHPPQQLTSTPKTTAKPKRATPTRQGSSGIGAGLGIMGLGMGMGVGMGVGVGVSGGRGSMEGSGSGRPSLDGGAPGSGSGRQSVDHGGAGKMSLEGGGGGRVGAEKGLGGRQTSEGGASVVSSVSEMGEKEKENVGARDEPETGSGGMKAWWKKQRSRPGTPTPVAGLTH